MTGQQRGDLLVIVDQLDVLIKFGGRVAGDGVPIPSHTLVDWRSKLEAIGREDPS